MNILKMELKLTVKETLIWTIALSVLIGIAAMFFPVFEQSMDEFSAVVENVPKLFLISVGFDLAKFSSFPAFLSFFIADVLIAMGIYAMKLGLLVSSREKTIGMSDFLLVKPCSRTRLILYKYLAAIFSLTVMTAVLFALAVIINLFLAGGNIKIIVYTFIAVLLTSYYFVSLGILISSLMSRNKSVLVIAVAVVFGIYFLTMIQRMFNDDKIKYISPFSQLDTSRLLVNTAFDKKLLTVNISLTLAMLILAIFFYNKENFRK